MDLTDDLTASWCRGRDAEGQYFLGSLGSPVVFAEENFDRDFSFRQGKGMD